MQNKEKFLESIEEFAECFVGREDTFQGFSSEKIINDAIWGTHSFQPYELSVISLPILQRLRQIKQMGFVNYVYPSAMHTRFEHTLGTTILAKRLFNHAKIEGEQFLDSKDLVCIRLSALLHDIGHCLYSHTSELIYGDLIKDFIEAENFNADPKPHEYLSYRLIKTAAFSKFFNFISNKYRMSIDSTEVANFVIGFPSSEKNRFKASIINGAFDADKLDYIFRDSRFSGLPLLLDLDRLMHEIRISDFNEITKDTEVKDLTIGISGVSSLEQIIFNKMLLFSTIYHHQKVKACDCMFKGVFEYIQENNIELPFRNKKLSFKDPTDFLWFTDTEFMAAGVQTGDKELHRMIHNILYRRPLKRALVISRKMIKQGDILKLLSTSVNNKQKNEELRRVAENIWLAADKPCSKHDVWIDIPTPPPFKESLTTYIRTDKTNIDKDLKPLSDFFPSQQWTDQYNTHKLKGHLFCPDSCREKIARAALKVFENDLNITFKEEALRSCKNYISI